MLMLAYLLPAIHATLGTVEFTPTAEAHYWSAPEPSHELMRVSL